MKHIKTYFIAVLLTSASVTVFAQTAPADTTIQFRAQGACGMCKTRIEKSLKLKGVQSATWDAASQTVTITYDPLMHQPETLQKKVAEVGHDTEQFKADDKVYAALPECCLYRENMEPVESFADSSAHMIRGIVLEDRNNQLYPLSNASIFWAGTNTGTTSNAHGEFRLPKEPASTSLVISYAGFKTDTVDAGQLSDLQITLSRKENLLGIVISARSRTTYIDQYNPMRVAVMTKKELLKAACCNLSESFETNPSVDVSYQDAATGSKQIQLLGLSGIYTQLTVENLPGPRGIATPLGLNSIAGPWVESIQLIKGTGSVVNGFESIAGQINVELKKPAGSEKLYLNGYLNNMGKSDFNLVYSQKLNSKWSTAFLLHDNFLNTKQDFNKDGFVDLPLGNQFSGINRWQFLNDKGWIAHFGVKAMVDDKEGGQLSYDHRYDQHSNSAYGVGIDTRRYEVFGKLGYVFPEKIYKSVGLQLSAFDHSQESFFGMNNYDAAQKNLYGNFLYQTRINNEAHTIKTGISFILDNYKEQLNGVHYNRKEMVPGVFGEYTFSPDKKLDVVAGMRIDHNNLYGWFATPRLNLRYMPFEKTTVRLSVGRGQRTANIFAENIGMLVSSRQLYIESSNGKGAYGLDPEVSWNKGVSVDQKLKLFGRDATIAMDFFRNDFSNQVVYNFEKAGEVKISNLEGRSFSNSYQAELNFIPAKKLEVRTAYRFFDVKTTYDGQLLQKPLTAQHRAFVNLAYDWKGWKMDYTLNYIGNKRLPSTEGNPSAYKMPLQSDDYVLMNAQISKALGKKKALELYLGGENLTGFFQEHAILAADQPFSQWFDASMIWGPVTGRMIYGGFRFSLK